MSRIAGSKFATRRELGAEIAIIDNTLETGAHPYGASPLFFNYAQVSTNITVGPPPAYTGGISYITTPLLSFTPGRWKSSTSLKVRVTATSVTVLWDVLPGGNPSAVGYAIFPIGKADDDDTRTFEFGLDIFVPLTLGFTLLVGKGGGVGSAVFRGGSLGIEKTGQLP